RRAAPAGASRIPFGRTVERAPESDALLGGGGGEVRRRRPERPGRGQKLGRAGGPEFRVERLRQQADFVRGDQSSRLGGLLQGRRPPGPLHLAEVAGRPCPAQTRLPPPPPPHPPPPPPHPPP